MTVADKAPPITEAQFQRQVVELAKILGWRVYHPFLSKWSEKGFPDLTMVRARDRRLIFAELKRDRGRLTEAQVEWQELLRPLSFNPSDFWPIKPRDLDDPTGPPTIEVFVWHPADWDRIQETLR